MSVAPEARHDNTKDGHDLTGEGTRPFPFLKAVKRTAQRSKLITKSMDEQTRQCLEEVIEYLWDDEYKSWQEDGRPKSHIFNCLEKLKRWLLDN